MKGKIVQGCDATGDAIQTYDDYIIIYLNTASSTPLLITYPE